MSQPILYPIMQGHTVPHGINVHQQASFSSAARNLVSVGVLPELNGYHYAFGQPTRVQPDVVPSSYIDQMEMALPPVRLVRPIWNLHSFTAMGKWAASKDLALWKEFKARGWKIMLTMFDGPSQQGWDWRGGRSVEATMAGWKRRHTYGWTKCMEAMAENDLLDAIYGFEGLNEPDAYNKMENSGAVTSSRAIWYYTEHNKNIWNIARSFTTEPHLIMSGWRWNGSMGPLSRVKIPEYGGKTAMEHLAEYYPDKEVLGSLHTGAPETFDLTPKTYWDRFGMSDMERKADWRFNPNQQIVTEVLSWRENGINNVPMTEPPQERFYIGNADGWHYFGLGLWYWPLSNFSTARLFDIHGSGTPRDLYRSLICGVTAAYCYPNRPEWFKGAQQGIKDATSPDTVSFAQSSNYDRRSTELGWAASEALPAQARLTRMFGGKGTCVLNLPGNQFNGAFGGDGWTVIYGTDTSWDSVYFGRGGGVVRTGAGLNDVQTRWGTVRVYAGPGHNAVYCFTGETTFPAINALHHETTVILDPAGTHYLYDWHRCDHKISFKGAFATPDALRAACRFEPSTLPSKWEHDLWIDLPGGGTVQMAFGRECMERIVSHCLDFADGWYAPGWTEPPDYDPAALTAPIIDPGPAFDALYVWESPKSPFYDHNGRQLDARFWDGTLANIKLWGAA